MPEKWRRLESLRCSGWKPLPLWVATLREGHTPLYGNKISPFGRNDNSPRNFEKV